MPIKCLAAGAVLAAGIRWLYVEGLRRAPSAVVRLVLLEDDESMVVERRGRQRGVRVIRAVVVSSSLALVTLRAGRWRARTLCIAGDAVAADAFRRLRVRLDLHAGPTGKTGRRFGFRVRRAGKTGSASG